MRDLEERRAIKATRLEKRREREKRRTQKAWVFDSVVVPVIVTILMQLLGDVLLGW